MAKKQIFWDIETTGLYPWRGNRVTCICAKDSDDNKISIVLDDEQKLINTFLDWLSARSSGEYELVTYNGKSFDENFILARLALSIDLNKKSGLFILDYDHADLFEEIKNQTGKFQSLNTVAKLLGCTPKSGTGMSAIKLWEQGRFQELRDYCGQDVDTTQEVYIKLREKS